MVRLLFTLCYTITTLPGPGLCCCTFRPSGQELAAPAQAEPCCPCCQHEPPPEQEPAPSRCGCKHQPADDATLSVATQPTASPAVSFDTPTSLAPPCLLIDATPAPPFREPARMLRVCHLLRC
jgi:hypothetical protein